MDAYTAIAREFFNQFLELKLQLESGVVTTHEHEKEIAKWRRANQELKASAEYLAKRNEDLERELGETQEELSKVRGQLNELIINHKLPEEVRGVPLEELMSERNFRQWRKMLSEMPKR